MALSLAFTLALSASHVHKTAIDAHDCAVCSVMADQLGAAPPPPVLVAAVQYLPYVITPAPVRTGVLSATALLPPSCGPPSTSV